MIDKSTIPSVFEEILTSGRVVITSLAICSLLYGLVILTFGQFVMSNRADGSLVRDGKGEVVGSSLIAQGFSRPEYFWPRPSAVDYNASAAGGSNLSPTNPELRQRAEVILTRMGGDTANPLPADLVAASGSGLDPHISLTAAKFQADRVAKARGLTITTVMALLEKSAKRAGGPLTPEPIVNVLLVNIDLDRLDK